MARLAQHDVALAAWELRSDRATWLRDLLGIATTVAGVEEGLAWSVRLERGEVRLTEIEGAREYAPWLQADHQGRMSADSLREAYSVRVPVSTMRGTLQAALGAVPEPIQAEFVRRGLEDVVLVAPRAGDEVAALGLPVPIGSRNAGRAAAEWTERWRSVALHIQHAIRVRRALSELDAQGPGGGILADFDARGRGSFAVPGMREELRERAALTQRKPSRTSLWNDMVVGRYSIVGYRTGGGALRFIAVANPDGAEGLRALSEVERMTVERLAAGESQKVVALDLGIRETSVSNIARRARAKLGVRDQTHLAAVWAATRG